ncbi:tripartite tricarboxylate transporter permease [Candidatus Woesearchaeota archaeon]|nr:tripartite tricarboxylate transporter permease [Candidatus Woesearchaeota archaeon]
MLGQILIAVSLGIFAGIFTGLIPGIHINLIAVLLLSASPFLLRFTNPLVLCIFIVAMAVTHTFLDFIPSIFLGAPESASALGVLPGHRYLLKGFGLMAVKLTLIGSFGALLLSIAIFPLLIPFVGFIYPLLKDYIGYMLVAVVIFMVLRDRKKLWALGIFLLSGCLGLIVFNIPNFSDPLFPMLSGLFGISTLIISLSQNEKIPKQKISQEVKVKKKIMLKALLSGEFSGFITAIMPGLGAATAAVISMQITRKLGDHGFMILLGSINTVNFVLSMATLYVLDKARNGAVIAVQKLIGETGIYVIIAFLCAALLAGCAGVYLGLKIGKAFSSLISKVNYKKLVISIIVLITLLVIVMTGPLGLLVLLVSTAVGIIPAEVKVTRTHSMGCLLLPVIMYFLF